MNNFQTELSKSLNVKCSGKDEPYDHPTIYLEIDKNIGYIECPYCSKKFILEKNEI